MANQMYIEQKDLCLQAMSVVLQHSAVAADQCNICILLQVSKGWRAAVLQSAESMTDVSFNKLLYTSQLRKIASFSEWLTKHPGLVRTLNIRHSYSQSFSETSTQSEEAAVLVAARQLVELSLQAAAAAAVLGVGAPLRMRSYNSTLCANTALLAALPVATLTSLNVILDRSNQFSTLGKLTNLQHLSLTVSAVREEATDSCLYEISRMTQLRQLLLSGIYISGNMQLLPAQLQVLELDCRRDHSVNVISTRMLLQHLTDLQHLRIRASHLMPGTVLPANLQSLELRAQWSLGDLVSLSSLHQLTSVVFSNKRLKGGQLRELETLPQLTCLSLTLEHTENLHEVAAAWQNLPLVHLYIAHHNLTATELHVLMQHVAVASRLTKLELFVSLDDDQVPPHGLAVCEHLRNLKNLEKMELQIGQPQQFNVLDAQHLTALSTLTSLILVDGGPYIDSPTVALLALTLTKLKLLWISVLNGDDDEDVISLSALPAIGRLTTLETLLLDTLPSTKDAHRGLQLLTGLSRLKRLDGFENAEPEALEAFWAAIRSQQEGHGQ